MKTLRDYIAEESQRAAGPVVGDEFAINIQEDCLLETHVIELVEDGFVVAADDKFLSLLESYGVTTEEIRRYGAVGSSPGQGYSVAEDDSADQKAAHDRGYSDAQRGIDKSPYNPGSPAERAYRAGQDAFTRHFDESQELRLIRSRAGVAEQNAASNDPVLAKAVDLAPVAPMGETEDDEDYDYFDDEDKPLDEGFFVIIASEDDGVFLGSVVKDGGKWRESGGQGPKPHNWGGTYMSYLDPQDVMTWIRQDYGRHYQVFGPFSDENEAMARVDTLSEAEYQGREVTLNKPTSGDVKKFKVYVKDPSTGNVKKVNFGDPNMRIKKSNPERRKSFRARHKCDTAKDKTTARYWSCRKW